MTMPSANLRPPSKRVTAQIDLDSYLVLERLAGEAKSKSVTVALQRALRVAGVLRDQAGDGFADVVVRNRLTGEERTILLPVS